MGSTDDHLHLVAGLLLPSDVSVLSVNYRLCQPPKFLDPLDDAVNALGGCSARKLSVAKESMKHLATELDRPSLKSHITGEQFNSENSQASK